MSYYSSYGSYLNTKLCCKDNIPGPQGSTGAQGFQGSTGAQGFQGSTGAQGFQGDTGAQGFQGSTGAQGFQGDTGAQGFQGDTGAQGFQGSTGAQGFQGSTGAQGFQGDTGAQGFQGSTGAQGFQGDTGAQGFQGSTGAQGATGLIGATGAAGVAGPVPLPNHQLPRIPYSVVIDPLIPGTPIINPVTTWYEYYHTADSQTPALVVGQPPLYPFPINYTPSLPTPIQSCTNQPYNIYFALCSSIEQALSSGLPISSANPIPIPAITPPNLFGPVLTTGITCNNSNFEVRNLNGCESIYAFVEILPVYVPIKYTMWLFTGPDGIAANAIGNNGDQFTPTAGPSLNPVVMPGYVIKLDWCATAEWLTNVPSLWLETQTSPFVVEVKMLLTPTNHTS